jgi:nicotinamidase-related amidase
MGAFKVGTKGAETIPELRRLGERILEVPGKRGLNAFSNTDLDNLFQQHEITNVAIAGVVTSICVDSTGRSAFERGYKVSILSDCTSGRTTFEQDFYCENVFPLYAEVLSHKQFIERLGTAV